MGNLLPSYLHYFLSTLLLTLGIPLVCGLAVRLCARLFAWLVGGRAERFFDVTSLLGTPVHELGHAAMCLLFGHKIVRMRLWAPSSKSGVYGYVEHSYSRRNPWAVLGNLFIGIGPLISGLAVVTLALRLCFFAEWQTCLATLHSPLTDPIEVVSALCALPAALPAAVLRNPLPSLLGIVLILSVCLHVSLSRQDIKGSLRALPLYLVLTIAFTLVSFLAGVSAPILSALLQFALRVLSLFGVVLAFSLVWVLGALLWRLLRALIALF